MSVKSFQDLRAWQSTRAFKLAVYELCSRTPLRTDPSLRDQLCRAAAAAVSDVAEGFGRFAPADFARFLGMARASLVEAQNHLQDAADKNHITEATQEAHCRLAQAAIRDVTALIEYLRSSTATENAKQARAKRQADRTRRTQNREPRT